MRPATADVLRRFYGVSVPKSLRAWALWQDDEPVGVAGYHITNGKAVVFSDVKDGLPKMTIWRGAKLFMDMLNLPAVCIATDTSGPMLKRLGWHHVGASEVGEVYEHV